MAKCGKSGRRSGPKGGAGRGAVQHPGEVLAQILEDTPPALAAKWFSVTPDELAAVLEGRAPMTPAMAAAAGTVFGTGSAPWLEMQAAWDEAAAAAEAARAAKAAARAAKAGGN